MVLTSLAAVCAQYLELALREWSAEELALLRGQLLQVSCLSLACCGHLTAGSGSLLDLVLLCLSQAMAALLHNSGKTVRSAARALFYAVRTLRTQCFLLDSC